MNKEKFLEYLSIYGTDLDTWPEDIKEAAAQAVRSSDELAQAFKAEKEFEQSLMAREFQNSSPDLSERIISNTLPADEPQSKSLIESVKDFFSILPLPSPAIALPVILVIGIVAGYLIPTENAVSEPEGVQVADVIYNYGGLYE